MLALRLRSAAHAATAFPQKLYDPRLDHSPRLDRIYFSCHHTLRITMPTSNSSAPNSPHLNDLKQPGLGAPRSTYGLESYVSQDIAISEGEDEPDVRARYRPFILDPQISGSDWVAKLELETASAMAWQNYELTGQRLRILVLYGSLRDRYVPF